MAVESTQRPAAGTVRPRPKREREEELLVWPDLVFVEFIAALLFTITFGILSVFINAPLLNRANADVTPNPSKAPWYFLNLQELLLHMDKAWAGVLLPTIALVFFASIPYIDRSREGQGVWFGTKNSVRLTVVTMFYALFVSVGLVVMDAGDRNLAPDFLGITVKTEMLTRWIPACDEDAEHQTTPCLRDEAGAEHTGIVTLKDLAKRFEYSVPFPDFLLDIMSEEPDEEANNRDGKLDWPEDVDKVPVPGNTIDWEYGTLHLWYGMNLNIATIMAEQVIPLVMIVGLAALILYVLFRIGWMRTRRDVFIVMFTAVMVSYLTLSMIGSFFRGEGQALIPPWDIKVDEG